MALLACAKVIINGNLLAAMEVLKCRVETFEVLAELGVNRKDVDIAYDDAMVLDAELIKLLETCTYKYEKLNAQLAQPE